MTSTLSDDGVSTPCEHTADLWYGRKQQIFPTRWLAPIYEPPSGQNGDACFDHCVDDSEILSGNIFCDKQRQPRC